MHYPDLDVNTGSADPTGYDIVVNATPLGMNEGDPLPIDMSLVAPTTFVGEVVMKTAVTPFLRAAQERGCETQVGTDMLFEQIPAYLEFFGFGTTTPDELRRRRADSSTDIPCSATIACKPETRASSAMRSIRARRVHREQEQK